MGSIEAVITMSVLPWFGIVLLTLILQKTVAERSAHCPNCFTSGCCAMNIDKMVTKLEAGETLRLTAQGSTSRGCSWWKLAEDESEHCCFTADPVDYKYVCGENHTNPEGCRKMEEVTIDMDIDMNRCIHIIEHVTNMDNGTYQCSIDINWQEPGGQTPNKFPVIVMNTWLKIHIPIGISM